MDIDLKSKGCLAEFLEGHYVLRYFVKELYLGLNLATQSASYFCNGQLPRKNKYNYNIILLFKSSRLFIDRKYQYLQFFFFIQTKLNSLTKPPKKSHKPGCLTIQTWLKYMDQDTRLKNIYICVLYVLRLI